jgi:hypothetical protein
VPKTAQKIQEGKMVKIKVRDWKIVGCCLTIFLIILLLDKGCIRVSFGKEIPTVVASVPVAKVIYREQEKVVVIAKPVIKSEVLIFNNFSGSEKILVFDEKGLLCEVLARHVQPINYAGHAGTLLRFEVVRDGENPHVLGTEDFKSGNREVVRFSREDSPYLRTMDLSILPPKS